MSSRVLLLAALVTLTCCVFAEATRQWETTHIGQNKCRTRVVITRLVRRWKVVPCRRHSDQSISSYRRGKWCVQPVNVYRRRVVTIIHCCPGWSVGSYFRCNVRVPMANCHGGCENNGTCQNTTGSCTCQPGYTGRRCEQVECDPECENEGVCVMSDGVPQCKCPKAFQGSRCEEAVCSKDCMNGGRCRAVGYSSLCVCPVGYSGPQCQFESRQGDCPVRRERECPSDDSGSSEESCDSDHECPGRQKCCGVPGCEYSVCLNPVPQGCPYNGRVYPVRAKFNADPCKVCTCMTPDEEAPYGGASCTQIRCPRIPLGYRRCKRQAGDNQCCKTCREPELTKPVNYTVPVFINCPVDPVTLDLPVTGRSVRLNQTLRAADMLRRGLEVEYSNLTFTWNNSIDKNIHLVMATAMDEWEEVIECSFIVRVRDPHPPEFDSCPEDIGPVAEPRVSWAVPTASDNIGLAEPPNSDYQPGQLFPFGQTLVTYTAEDFEGNEALCQFLVFVDPPTTPEPGNSVGDHERLANSDAPVTVNLHYVYIFSALGVFLLLLVLGAIAFFFLLRRRRRSAQGVVYTCKDDAPPPYASVDTNKTLYISETAAIPKYFPEAPSGSYENPAYAVVGDSTPYKEQNSENHVSDVVQ